MLDPFVSKAAPRGIDSVAKSTEQNPVKLGESKFDQVRSRMLDEQAAQVKLPPEVRQVPPEQESALQTKLTSQIQTTGAGSTHQVLGVHMKHAKERVEQLTSRVNMLPKTAAFEPFRQRLASIDNQYHSAGKLMSSIQGSTNPGDLMKVQMQMYQLTENLELMSKVVEQVTSGVKSILQTQL